VSQEPLNPASSVQAPDVTTSAASVAAPPEIATLSGRRRGAIWALVVVASLIGVLSILSTWVNRQLLSDSAATTTSTALVQDAAIRSALSVYLVDQLYTNVDVAAELEQRLPKQLKPLAAPAAAALRDPAAQGVDLLLARPHVQALFVRSSALAQKQLFNVLENRTGAGITTGSGNVTVDLGALVAELGTQLGLPTAALDQLPPGTGVITVMRSDQLGLAQTGLSTVRILSVWLLVLVLAMYALALYLAVGIRRQTLRNIGWAFVIVGLIVVAARNVIGNYAVDSLTTSVYRTPAHHVWLILTSTLAEIGWSIVFYGVIAVVGAVLAGPARPATAFRSRIAPTLKQSPGIMWVAVALVYLLLVVWGGTHALRTPFGILVLGALLATGVVAFRRETLREFPDATEGSGLVAAIAAAGGRVGSAAAAWRHAHHAPAAARSTTDELAHLVELHDRGALTDEEFARAKEHLLS